MPDAIEITNDLTILSPSVYESDSILIPKNTSVIVARVPVAAAKKSWNKNDKSNVCLSFVMLCVFLHRNVSFFRTITRFLLTKTPR